MTRRLDVATDDRVRDIVFAEYPGYRPLTLDLHLPAEPAAAIILFVHGGGWRVGSRRTFGPNFTAEQSFDRIVAAGFAVVSVDYRLSSEAHFPAQVDDVRAGLEWIRQHAAEYGLGSGPVILWGESAGATLAALVGLEVDSGVSGVVDWFGPSNLTSMASLSTPEELARTRESLWLGGTALEHPETARRASPVFQVHPKSPPFHIEHGDADQFVPFSQSQELSNALHAVGADVELRAVSGANHLWNGVSDTAPLIDRALAFAARVAALAPTEPTEPAEQAVNR